MIYFCGSEKHGWQAPLNPTATDVKEGHQSWSMARCVAWEDRDPAHVQERRRRSWRKRKLQRPPARRQRERREPEGPPAVPERGGLTDADGAFDRSEHGMKSPQARA